MICRECGSKNLWTSRVRATDIGQLLMLKLPVRCHTCLKRDFVRLAEARRIERAELASLDEPQGQGQNQH